jgi:hypothetical protein
MIPHRDHLKVPVTNRPSRSRFGQELTRRCAIIPIPRPCVVNPTSLRLALPRNAMPTAAARSTALAAVEHYHATLANGCAYLARHRAPGLSSSPALTRLRRAGNCLKELDRFLTLLLDACARAQAMPPADLSAFERWTNTAGKLRRISGSGTETQRLQAIDRLRRTACGDMCGRPRALLIKDLAIATCGAAHPMTGREAAESLTNEALAAIAEFYLGIGHKLLLDTVDSAIALDFSNIKAHLGVANVACDGN